MNGYYDDISKTSWREDEKHWTCVPGLRKRVEGLEALNDGSVFDWCEDVKARLINERDALQAALDAANQYFPVVMPIYRKALEEIAEEPCEYVDSSAPKKSHICKVSLKHDRVSWCNPCIAREALEAE